MIAENGSVPICRDHATKITRCIPCAQKLAKFDASMPKVTASAWREGDEPAMAYHDRVDRAALENQARLHSWAVANIYVDEELPF